MLSSSTPAITEFDPHVIPMQYAVICAIRRDFDYKKGTHEILLSGSVGSSKSLLMAHLGLTHCLMNGGARVGICRRALPDIKKTIFQKICEHLIADKNFVQGRDYWITETQARIRFRNKSEIISCSWADKKYQKFRSLELSALLVEELIENDDEDQQAYQELKMRVGRLPHIKEKFIIAATNPGDPSHWAHRYFIESQSETRHVYYSVTTDNPFLPPEYIEQLKRDLDPKMARRMIYGEWIEISGDSVYYAYKNEKHFRKNAKYEINKSHPLSISFDFNIGEGKPMSCVVDQFVDGHFHFFDEAVIKGARTLDILEELQLKGYFDLGIPIEIHGDASGRAKDTRSIHSDFDIILKFLNNYQPKNGGRLNVRLCVPPANPLVRTRHNIVNAYLENDLGESRISVYPNAKTLDEGFRLVKLKDGANYIEDDSKHYQHITTAAGYRICWHHLTTSRGSSRTIRL